MVSTYLQVVDKQFGALVSRKMNMQISIINRSFPRINSDCQEPDGSLVQNSGWVEKESKREEKKKKLDREDNRVDETNEKKKKKWSIDSHKT